MVSTQAEIIGANCSAALAFNSPKGTRKTLAALKVRPESRRRILNPDGTVFAG